MENTIKLKDNLYITTDLKVPVDAKLKLSGIAKFIGEEECRPYMPFAGSGMFVNFCDVCNPLVSSRDSLISAVDKLKNDPNKSISKVKFSIYAL